MQRNFEICEKFIKSNRLKQDWGKNQGDVNRKIVFKM